MKNRDTKQDQQLRYEMVQRQLMERNIRDSAVLEVMESLARHFFVPPEYRDLAYKDRALPIGYNQTISQPYMVALMTATLDLKGKAKKILEIGTGSGYQTAILCALNARVDSVERIKPLAISAESLLNQMGYYPRIFVGDGSSDLPPDETYDGILVAAAAPSVPTAYIERLNPGGTLVIPLGDRNNQVLKKFVHQGDHLSEKSITRCVFVPLIGAYGFSDDG